MKLTTEEVRSFWEKNPLFSGESPYEAGTREFFEEHRLTVLNDVLAGELERMPFFPEETMGRRFLDLGCGVGFWSVEAQLRRPGLEMHAADLTMKGLKMTARRLDLYGVQAALSQQDAERLGYGDERFDHVNCQGVIHHTPDPAAVFREIARVLKPGGTASISVYYRNIFLRGWRLLYPLGLLLNRWGARLKGRGREDIFLRRDPEELVRRFDGADNPIGRAYGKKEIINMAAPFFTLRRSFLFFFPARVFPFRLPAFLHRRLQRACGFMIHLNLEKKRVET